MPVGWYNYGELDCEYYFSTDSFFLYNHAPQKTGKAIMVTYFVGRGRYGGITSLDKTVPLRGYTLCRLLEKMKPQKLYY